MMTEMSVESVNDGGHTDHAPENCSRKLPRSRIDSVRAATVAAFMSDASNAT